MNKKIKRLFWCDQPHSHFLEQLYWPHASRSPHNSKHMFDIYTLTHLFWPIVVALLAKWIFGTERWVVIGVIIGTLLFEIYENLPAQIKRYRRIEIDSQGITTYRGDSVINVIGDTIANIIGVYIAFYYSLQTSTLTLAATFVIVVKVLGMSYWTDFIGFVSGLK